MSYPNSNKLGSGHNWYFDGFGASGNDQQTFYYPREQSNTSNVLTNGQNVGYQEPYRVGNNNNVIYPTNTNYNPAFQQTQQFHPPQHYPQQAVYRPAFYPSSDNGSQQNQILRDSPMNFCVPNSNTTQTTNNDEGPQGGFHLLDISSSHQNSKFSSNQALPPKNDKSLLEMTDEELSEDLKDWCPDFSGPIIFTQIPLEQYEVMQTNDVPASAPIRTHSSTSSSTTTTANPVGRPPTYKTEEEKEEAHRIASRKSYSKRKDEKAEYRKGLENTVFTTETENQNLRQTLATLKTRFAPFFNYNLQFLNEEDREYALQMQLQMFHD